MNRSFKGILYTVITIFVIILVVKFLIGALPYIIIIGLILWLLFKFKNRKKAKERNKEAENSYYKKETYSSKEYEEKEENDDEFDTSNAIDVDFEDVDKR